MSIRTAHTIEVDVPHTGFRATDIAAVKAALQPHLAKNFRAPYYLELQGAPMFDDGRIRLIYTIFPAETYLRPQSQRGGPEIAKERMAA